jgi:uncharacterized membrane protein (DUF2068 family)
MRVPVRWARWPISGRHSILSAMPLKKTGASPMRRDAWVVLIGIFKLLKGAACLILGFGLLRMLHKDVAAVALHYLEALRTDPDNRYIHSTLLKIFRVTPKQLRELSAGSFVYAALFLTEGTGLVLRKHWAEYLAVISTGLFIPLEAYEIYHHLTWTRLIVTAINVLTVWYLAMRIVKRHR